MTKAGSKQKKNAVSSAPEEPAMDETPENLDKVRDILFGGQMRAVDQRLASLEERDPNMPYQNVWPVGESLRADPRFHDLLRRVGLPL